MWVFFLIAFDSTKESVLPEVSKAVHLKLTWVFLHSFALLTRSHVFSRLIQTAEEDFYIRVKSLQQRHIPWRKVRQKGKQKNLAVNILLFLTWLPLLKLKSLITFFLKWIFLVFLYTFNIPAYIFSKHHFLKKSHHLNIFKCFVKMLASNFLFCFVLFFVLQSYIRDQTLLRYQVFNAKDYSLRTKVLVLWKL